MRGLIQSVVLAGTFLAAGAHAAPAGDAALQEIGQQYAAAKARCGSKQELACLQRNGFKVVQDTGKAFVISLPGGGKAKIVKPAQEDENEPMSALHYVSFDAKEGWHYFEQESFEATMTTCIDALTGLQLQCGSSSPQRGWVADWSEYNESGGTGYLMIFSRKGRQPGSEMPQAVLDFQPQAALRKLAWVDEQRLAVEVQCRNRRWQRVELKLEQGRWRAPDVRRCTGA